MSSVSTGDRGYEFPMVGPMLVTYELTSGENGGTTAAIRGRPLASEQAAAWPHVEEPVVGAFDHAAQALEAAMSTVAVPA